MNYAVITCINGNFKVQSEHGNDYQKAEIKFHQLCASYVAGADVNYAEVRIVNQDLDTLKREHIVHESQTEQTGE